MSLAIFDDPDEAPQNVTAASVSVTYRAQGSQPAGQYGAWQWDKSTWEHSVYSDRTIGRETGADVEDELEEEIDLEEERRKAKDRQKAIEDALGE